MTLAVAATFGSLPEASIAFSSLESAGFDPVAGFNMNTPGTSDGMAPSAYRVLVPEDQVQAARKFLSELRQAFAEPSEDENEPEAAEESKIVPGQTSLGRMRMVARFLVAGALLVLIVLMVLPLVVR